jgi:hypothetical protein
MQHDFDQEGGLPLCEGECRDALEALIVGHRNSSKM